MKVDLNNKIKVDIDDSFPTGTIALEENGYRKTGEEVFAGYHGDLKVFEKDGKRYAFISMDHFNDHIYSVTLAPIIE